MPSHEGTLAPLANTIELVLPSADPSPQPKWQIDQFGHFCTADDHLIRGSLGPPEFITQMASQSVHPLLHNSW